MRGICSSTRALLYVIAALSLSKPLAAEELSLQQAIDNAIRNNPTIASANLSAEASRHAAKGARALVNPEVSVAPSIVGDAGADSALFFSQPLEINGSRKVRGDIAAGQAQAVSYEAQAVKRDVVLQVKQTYWDLVRTQELVKLSRENLKYLEEINAAVQRQYEVGTVPGTQSIKSEVELARARQELAQAELDMSQAQSLLNSLLNCPQNTPITASSPLVFSEPAIRTESLLAMCRTRPELSAAQAKLTSARGEIKAARLRRVPDVAVQARRESFSSDSDGGVALAFTLPIFDWGSAKAEKRRAESAALSQEKQLQAVANGVNLQVEQAAQQVEASAAIVREYQSEILSKSEELAVAAKKGYEKGATGYLEVLEAQRTMRNVRSEYLTSLADYSKSIAQLEWAAGCDLSNTRLTEVEK